jgi:hypothetical protein
MSLPQGDPGVTVGPAAVGGVQGMGAPVMDETVTGAEGGLPGVTVGISMAGKPIVGVPVIGLPLEVPAVTERPAVGTAVVGAPGRGAPVMDETVTGAAKGFTAGLSLAGTPIVGAPVMGLPLGDPGVTVGPAVVGAPRKGSTCQV